MKNAVMNFDDFAERMLGEYEMLNETQVVLAEPPSRERLFELFTAFRVFFDMMEEQMSGKKPKEKEEDEIKDFIDFLKKMGNDKGKNGGWSADDFWD